MAATRILLGIICFALIGSNKLSGGGVLTLRERIVQRADREIGVREQTGHNDGKRVSQYLAAVGLKRPEPWCSAFVCWLYLNEGLPGPKSGWSPDLFPQSRLSLAALPGDVLGIYFPDKKRIAHVGLITHVDGSWLTSTEGNTNVAGSREGDGVYKKLRHIKTIYRIADWLTIKKAVP